MRDEPLGHSTIFNIYDTTVDRDLKTLGPGLSRWIRPLAAGTVVVVRDDDTVVTIPDGFSGTAFLWGVKTIKDTSTCTAVEVSW